MRILNRSENQALDSIEIFLTRDEAEELRARISGLLDNPSAHHIHLDADEMNGRFERELIIAIYEKGNLSEFDERSRKLIVEGK
ncbi:MAG: hypothetical protein ABIY50_11695 [Ignavibacteria bacterium]